MTTQEFEDMLIYWRDNDMNGNGDPSDEIPMAGTLATDGGDFTVYLLNAFQATPQYDSMVANEEGEVELIAITDEYREGLKWIHHLYEEGLIAEETFIQDNSQLQSLVNNNDPTARIVGAFGGFWAGVTVSPSSMENAYDVYDVLAPLEGPTACGRRPLPVICRWNLKARLPSLASARTSPSSGWIGGSATKAWS